MVAPPSHTAEIATRPERRVRETSGARAVITRSKIADGAIRVLAQSGVAGLTHRAVAKAAGVSLAATTYHFDTKPDIIEHASHVLLDDYLDAFERVQSRISNGQDTRFASMLDLVNHVVRNAVGNQQIRSLAWCELILHAGLNPRGKTVAQSWYRGIDAVWHEIAHVVEPGPAPLRASAAVDLAIGLSFCLLPLQFDSAGAEGILTGKQEIERSLENLSKNQKKQDNSAGRTSPQKDKRRFADKRQQIIDAAISIIIDEGASNVTYRRIAEVMGITRSGPSYYFDTIDDILSAAQITLFRRAKERYRAGLGSTAEADEIDTARLVDLTTAIYFKEALENGQENIGYYSAWLRASSNPVLRPTVAASFLDLHHAWMRRIGSASADRQPSETMALHMQALFIGKLVRAIAASNDVSELALAREDFANVLSIHRAVMAEPTPPQKRE